MPPNSRCARATASKCNVFRSRASQAMACPPRSGACPTLRRDRLGGGWLVAGWVGGSVDDLLSLQHSKGIDTCSAASRHDARQYGRNRDEGRHNSVADRIERAYAIE